MYVCTPNFIKKSQETSQKNANSKTQSSLTGATGFGRFIYNNLPPTTAAATTYTTEYRAEKGKS
jgi:hypothetical protein